MMKVKHVFVNRRYHAHDIGSMLSWHDITYDIMHMTSLRYHGMTSYIYTDNITLPYDIMAWHHILCRYHGATKLSWWIIMMWCADMTSHNANIMGMTSDVLSWVIMGYHGMTSDVLSWVIMAWHRMYYHGMTSILHRDQDNKQWRLFLVHMVKGSYSFYWQGYRRRI